MNTFIVVKSKSKLSNRTAYIRKFKLTFFAFKNIYHIVRITIQRIFKNVKSFFWLCLFLTLLFSESHWTICPSQSQDLPSLSNWTKTALNKWSLRLLAFLNPIIGISEKTLLWAWSGVSKNGTRSRIKWLLYLSVLVSALPFLYSLFLITIFPGHYIFYQKISNLSISY